MRRICAWLVSSQRPIEMRSFSKTPHDEQKRTVMTRRP